MALELKDLGAVAHDAWKYLAGGAGGLLLNQAWREWRRHRAARAELERVRFERLYAPLNTLFQTRHVESAVVIMRGHLYLRLRHSRRLLRQGRLLAAWHGLWDRGETEPSAEMSFGDAFPLDEIHGIVNANAQYADRRLVLLVRTADRSRYERTHPQDNGITREEYALLCHIGDEWERLSKALERRGLPAPPSDAPAG